MGPDARQFMSEEIARGEPTGTSFLDGRAAIVGLMLRGVVVGRHHQSIPMAGTRSGIEGLLPKLIEMTLWPSWSVPTSRC